MPVPCSPIGSLACPTSAPFSQSPEIAYFASVVSSRLSSLAAFLASPTAPPASDSPEPTTATSGPNASECFGSFDPALPSSRMFPGSSQASPLPRMVEMAKDFFSTGFCQTWPKSGLLVNGKLYQQQTLAQSLAKDRPTNGTASGSSALTNEAWLTPRANEPEDDPGFVARNGDRGAHCSGSLGQQVKKEQWPTASARDWKDTPGMALEGTNPDGSHRNRTDLLPRKVYEMERSGPPPAASGLPDPVKRSTSGSQAEQPEDWPTPASDSGNGGPHGLGGGSGNNAKLARLGFKEMGTGKLNPSWVETLQGVPLGWTQLPYRFKKGRR